MTALNSGGIPNTNQQDKADLLIAEPMALLLEKEQLIGEQKVIIERKSEVISEQQKRIALLEEAVRLSKIKRFAPPPVNRAINAHSLMKPRLKPTPRRKATLNLR